MRVIRGEMRLSAILHCVALAESLLAAVERALTQAGVVLPWRRGKGVATPSPALPVRREPPWTTCAASHKACATLMRGWTLTVFCLRESIVS